MANKNTKQKNASRAVKTGARETISTNRKRNMAMRVYHNTDASGRKCSLTAHEPLVKGEYVTFKNHTQYKDFPYRQFKQ